MRIRRNFTRMTALLDYSELQNITELFPDPLSVAGTY